ncbi:MAG: hypothetical protein LUD27_04015 [Clostridia bacterium]|nr:hypothetical protein [Clostridia bacterium]
MDEYIQDPLIEEAICILNENYADIGIHTGYVGIVIENLLVKRGSILADFYDPFTGKDLAVATEIRQEDFKVLTGTLDDKLIVKKYKDLFSN